MRYEKQETGDRRQETWGVGCWVWGGKCEVGIPGGPPFIICRVFLTYFCCVVRHQVIFLYSQYLVKCNFLPLRHLRGDANDDADAQLWSLTTWTLCRLSRWLRRCRVVIVINYVTQTWVSVVVDYADTTVTKHTPAVIWRWKKVVECPCIPIPIILKRVERN